MDIETETFEILRILALPYQELAKYLPAWQEDIVFGGPEAEVTHCFRFSSECVLALTDEALAKYTASFWDDQSIETLQHLRTAVLMALQLREVDDNFLVIDESKPIRTAIEGIWSLLRVLAEMALRAHGQVPESPKFSFDALLKKWGLERRQRSVKAKNAK